MMAPSNCSISTDRSAVIERLELQHSDNPPARAVVPLTACNHCGLAVPLALCVEGETEQFCCAGCRSVYRIIHSAGLERYYGLLRRETLQSSALRQSDASNPINNRYAAFDDPSFHRLYVTAADRQVRSGLLSVDLFIPAVHCAACVWLIEKLPRVCAGVVESRLDLGRSLARITWNPKIVQLSHIASALHSLGYSPTPAQGRAGTSLHRIISDRRQLATLGVAGACAGNVMLLAIAMYAGMFDAIEHSTLQLFRWVSMGISTIAVLWPGNVFLVGAWSAIRTRVMHLDLPIALGLCAGVIWGVFSTVRGSGEVYFDSISVLVFALLVGRYLQSRQHRASADALELLFSMTPTTAMVCDSVNSSETRPVPVASIRVGMYVEILTGETIPADGTIVRGRSRVDQSLMTGESRPVYVQPGDRIVAGSVNLESVLRITVDATGEQTRVGQLMRMVEEAATRRAPIVRSADRLAGWFVAGMIALAGMTVAVWWAVDPAKAVEHAIALLIVTCPCALGLATPMAVTAAIGRAARQDLLIKGGDAVEKLAKSGMMFIDKTGTLTDGHMSVVHWIGDESLQPIVAAIERHSSHPIAKAIVRHVDVPSLDMTNVRNLPGCGMIGSCDGSTYCIGSPDFVRASSSDCLAGLQHIEEQFAAEGLTSVLVSRDGHIVAAIGLGDQLRQDAAKCVNDVRKLGWHVRMLTGDHASVALRIGNSLGFRSEDVISQATPEQKLEIIRNAVRAGGQVVMVGDGVNDAAALAAATVGVAVHGGAEASLRAADVYLNRPGLRPVVELLEGSRRTMMVIRRNLLFSLGYNIVAASLATAGLINPLIAAVLMPTSSLTVVTLSFRSRTFQEPKTPCP